MKKLAALLLVLVMLVSAFAACGEDSNPGLDKAVEFVNALYKDADGSETPSDYEVIGQAVVDGVTYTIDWTCDKEEVKIVPNEETKMVKIDVDEESTEDVVYVLTATIKDPDGNTATCSFTHTVPKFEVLTIAAAAALEDGTAVVISGKVVSIDTAWSEQYKNITVTIEDSEGTQIQLYRLATNVVVGDVLVVKGKVDSYNGKKQIAQGATAEVIDHIETVINYTEMSITNALAADDGVFVQISGVVTEIETAWNAGYGNISVYIQDATGAKAYLYRLATEVTVGDSITVKGKVGSYEGAKQIVSATATVDAHYTASTVTEALAAADNALVAVNGNVKAIDSETGVITLVDDDNKTILVAISTTVAVGDDITVFGKVGTVGEGETATKQIVSGFAIPYQAYAEVTIPEAIAADKDTKVLVTGTVSFISSAWSTKYNNMDIYIVDAQGNALYVYRLGTQVALGDTITVKGKVDEYNGAKQIAQGATATVNSSNPDWEPTYSEMTIAQANAATPGTGAIISGVVIEINTAWNEEYGNITVTITDGTNTIKLYRLATNVALNDIITVTGAVGKGEIGAGATAVKTGTHDTCTCTTLANKCDVCGKITEHTCVDDNTDDNCDACGEKMPVQLGTPLATFTFGENGATGHVDGDTNSAYTETQGNYTLTLTGSSKVYSGGKDEKGNSALKLGTSSAVGTFTFTVGDDVKIVVIKVANYKAKSGAVDVNGVDYTLTTQSNNGEYDVITIDTSVTKTITFTSGASGEKRCMIDAIEFHGAAAE